MRLGLRHVGYGLWVIGVSLTFRATVLMMDLSASARRG
jgi:hypothetical protein